MAKRIQVGGRIESKEVGGIVTGAAEILDDAKGKKQSVINQETDDELLRLDQSKQDNLTFDNAPTDGSDNPVKSGGVYAADKALSDAIEAILLLIPSAASALNKLVDMAMMNSSISTATATFRGTYNVVTDLSLTIDATHEQIVTALGNAISMADNNDYAFVQVPVSAESTDIRRTERYKFNGTAWGYEYDLNTSGFTAAQWAAINSGITIALVGKLIGLPTSSELQALLGQKQDTLTFDNIPVSGSANPVKSGGVYSAINDEKTAREQLAQTVTGIDGRVGDVEEVIPTGAAANNKLVANNSMEAYVTSIIEAITASFTISTADGHINFTLTQTNGRVASITLTSSDIASAQALTALTGRVSTAESNITSLGGRVSTAESNITSLGGRVSTNETDIAELQELYNSLQQSKPAPVTELPSTGQQQGVIYRLAGTTSYSDYMWNGSTWVLMATYNNAIDPRPKKASQNLVTSGGVFDNMGALDVSELNATENPHTLAKYADLSAALAAIPTDYQKGGMSIKFVQSSDNKYVQFRCIANEFTTNITMWKDEDEVHIEKTWEPDFAISDENKNLIVSFYGGGIKTKNFDSNKVNRPEESLLDADFGIADENRNVIVSFANGNIKTKNFDSEDFNKSVGELGSIKTYNKKFYTKQLDDDFVHNGVGLIGNFVKREIDGVVCACTYSWGSELVFKVQNTTSITANFKIDNNSYIQKFIVSIDDGEWSNHYDVSNSVQIASNISTGIHTIKLRLSDAYNRDSQYSTMKGCMNFWNLTLDNGAVCTPMTYKNRGILVLGDSISSWAPNVYQSYNFVLADMLNSYIINSSLPGMGLVHGSAETLPTCQQLFDSAFVGAINYVNTPDFVLVAIGQNDTGTVSYGDYVDAYKELLDSIRTRFGGVLIFAMMPFRGQRYEETVEAIEDYDNVVLIDTRRLAGTYTTSDGLHPDANGAKVCASFIFDKISKYTGEYYYNNI